MTLNHLSEKQRLKEAIWRIQGLIERQPRMAECRKKIIHAECRLLAAALKVEAL